MLVCGKCANDLDVDCFSRNARTKNGLCSMCKTCSAEYQKQYRARNADRLQMKNKDYYAEHKEEIIAKSQGRYAEKKEDILAYCHQRYEDKKEEISAKASQHYQKNKDRIKAKTSRYKVERYRHDPKFCAIMRLRHRLREAFKRYSRNGKTKPSADYGIDYDA